jgi:hypothetical protein
VAREKENRKETEGKHRQQLVPAVAHKYTHKNLVGGLEEPVEGVDLELAVTLPRRVVLLEGVILVLINDVGIQTSKVGVVKVDVDGLTH